jgi:protein-S-isoprenylcysteine O-methyltransferase Ste14
LTPDRRGSVVHTHIHLFFRIDYLGLVMLYAGIAVLRNALWAILLLPVVMYVIQREVIGREERYLERTFGEEYLAYKARVRRWV